MKKLFLVILAGGMIFTACKKEEKEFNMKGSSLENNSLKTLAPPPSGMLGYYYLAQANVNVDGVLCDKYVSNTNPLSVVYIPTGNDKCIFRRYKLDAYVEYGALQCSREPIKECYNRADGSIAVKRNAHIEFYF